MPTSQSYFGDYTDRSQPTLNTVADYINDARVLLQDLIPPYRYDDQSLLTALNVTLLEARRLRSDLFVFNLAAKGQAQHFDVVDDTYVAIEAQFRLALLHGMCGHALERDQEDVQDMRASSFLNLFSVGMVGHTLPGVAGGSGPPQRQQGPNQ